MHINNAIRLLRETCAPKHVASSTEKTYAQWLARYAAFLKARNPKPLVTAEHLPEAGRFVDSGRYRAAATV